jgi:hypothetical protein
MSRYFGVALGAEAQIDKLTEPCSVSATFSSRRPLPFRGTMINFSLSDFLMAYRLLVQEKVAAEEKGRALIKLATVGDTFRNVEWATTTLARLSSDEMKSRLAEALKCLRTEGAAYSTVAYELDHVMRQLEDRVRVESLFRYETSKANLLRAIPQQWKQTLASFYLTDDLYTDIRAGVDCFALGHFTASIFHMMRVAEVGLRALGKERGVVLPKDKPVEYGTWQEILREIDAKIKEVGRAMAPGPAKDLALAFYNNALISLNALKDIFRNQTMHVRYQFNQQEAAKAMTLTNEFMEKLSFEIFDDMDEGERIDWAQSAAELLGPRDE